MRDTVHIDYTLVSMNTRGLSRFVLLIQNSYQQVSLGIKMALKGGDRSSVRINRVLLTRVYYIVYK